VFSRFFFVNTLQDRDGPATLYGFIFFIIPAVLLVFWVIAMLGLVRDLISRRTGSRFQLRLLGYFSLIVLFAAAPATIITAQGVIEFVRFWRTIDINTAMDFAQELAMNAYSLELEKFETLTKEPIFYQKISGVAEGHVFPEGVIGVQDFALQSNEIWESQSFWGEPVQKLPVPPSLQEGFASREMPRDMDVVRYVMYPAKKALRVVSFNLGAGFDRSLTMIENEKLRFDMINSLQIKIKPLLVLYYGVFFFPSLLMTLIIAISFTHRITQPILELTEATRQVAAGDFKVHIITRRHDELGLLIRSFNTMVQDLESFKTSLLKAEKISAWQSMAEQLAHEIKNPLTPIKLSAERVLRRWRNSPERIGEILETSMLAIIQETDNLSTLLTEFRTLSRPLEPSQSWTKLGELTEEIIAPYSSSHPKVRFNAAYVDRDVSVKIERHRLTQVLTNLIINGIDAMNGTGTIEIRTDIVKKRESQYCRLSIRDTGKGIAEQEKSQIFTPYFTTKASGTGLGLPIVERIVQDHGGTIWFNSAEAVGTTFFIDLPVDVPDKTQEKGEL
jgi:nitrogen fixation/metabolism regulation signal transduction histidine kinase